MSKLLKLCEERDIKLTGQRRTIIEVLEAASDHPSVEEIYARAHKRDASISIATVYRTMKLFEEHGIIKRHDFFKDGKGRYEQMFGEHHDHMINVQTGEVIEFYSEELEKLQEKIAKQYGVTIVDHRLELYVIKK